MHCHHRARLHCQVLVQSRLHQRQRLAATAAAKHVYSAPTAKNLERAGGSSTERPSHELLLFSHLHNGMQALSICVRSELWIVQRKEAALHSLQQQVVSECEKPELERKKHEYEIRAVRAKHELFQLRAAGADAGHSRLTREELDSLKREMTSSGQTADLHQRSGCLQSSLRRYHIQPWHH